MIDARLTTLSAFHILEEVAGASFPFVIPRMAVVSTLVREENDPDDPAMQLTVQLGDNLLIQGPFGAEFQGRNFSRSVAEIHNLVIMAPGELRVTLKMGDVQIAEWIVNISRINDPAIEVQNVEHREPQPAPV